tara:strand:- start:362 stop:661 length:300 start_codon:yes stop_codon:yes gene_type:complete
MKSQIVSISNNFKNACLGIYGHKVLLAGETSNDLHEFVAVTAIEDSVISYNKSVVEFETYGDNSVSSLEIKTGMTLILGSIKNVNVVSGKIFANLLTRP